MKGSTRRQVILATSTVSGALLAGCGVGDAANKGTVLPPKKLRSGITLTWRSYVTDQLAAEVGKIWAAKHPDIKLTHAPSTAAEITQKLIAEIAAGTPVDVAMSGYRDVPALQRQLTNIEPYVRRDKYAIQDFIPAAVNQYKYGSGQYAMPNSYPVRVGVYNATLFAKRGVKPPPSTWDAAWTWDDFVNTARAVNDPNADQPVWAVSWDKTVGVPNLLQVIMFCNNNGGAWIRDDGKECLLTQPRSREALQFMQDLIQRHHVAPDPATLSQPGADLFLQGKAAWGSWGPVSLANYRKTLMFDWGLTPIPTGAGVKQRSTVMDGSAWMMLDAANNKEEAWELLQTLAGPEYERAAAEIVGYVPPRRALMQDYTKTEPPKNFKVLLDASEHTYLFPQSPWLGEADTALAPLLNDLWAGKKSANTVAEEGKRLLDPILQKDFSFKTN